MRVLLTPAAQIPRVEFRALLTGCANRSRRRCEPDPPPCYGARRRNRSSWLSIESTRKAKSCAGTAAKRQVMPEIVVRVSLLYRLGQPDAFPVLATSRSGYPPHCTPLHTPPHPTSPP